jgi:hypothetical protein
MTQDRYGFDAAPKLFSELYSTSLFGSALFQIPVFQRAYEWDKVQRQALFEDIENADGAVGHFVGPIFVTQNGSYKEIIDGQQRLTTLSLLILGIIKVLKQKQLYEHFLQMLPKVSTPDSIILLTHGEPQNAHGSIESAPGVFFTLRLTPSDQKNNYQEYCNIVAEVLKVQFFPTLTPRINYTGKKISNAFKHITDWLSIIEENNDDQNLLVKKFAILYMKILDLRFVYITAFDSSGVMELFNGLNAKGLSLTVTDVIKNIILKHFVKENSTLSRTDYVVNVWQEFVTKIDQKFHAAYLRHSIYSLVYVDKFAVSEQHNSIKSPLKDKQIGVYYDDLLTTNSDKDQFIRRFKENTEIYDVLTNPENGINLNSTKEQKLLYELKLIKALPSYPLLLMMKRLQVNQTVLHSTIELISKIFLRQHITDYPKVSFLDNQIFQLLLSFSSSPGLANNFAHIQNSLLLRQDGAAAYSSIEILRAKLSEPIYDADSALTRYLLIKLSAQLGAIGTHPKLASHYDWFARFNRFRDVSKKTPLFSIEHIMPQSLNSSDEWGQMLLRDKQGNTSDDAHIQNYLTKYLHTLGNLTLTIDNSSLGVQSFQNKQAMTRTYNHPTYSSDSEDTFDEVYLVGYKDGSPLNDMPYSTSQGQYCLADAPTWNSNHIESRTSAMVNILASYMKFPTE